MYINLYCLILPNTCIISLSLLFINLYFMFCIGLHNILVPGQSIYRLSVNFFELVILTDIGYLTDHAYFSIFTHYVYNQIHLYNLKWQMHFANLIILLI